MFRPVRKRISRLWAALGLLSVEMVVLLISFFISIIVFVRVARAIFIHRRKAFDEMVFEKIRPFVSDGTTSFMQFITFFATHTFLIPANLVLLGYFLFVKKSRWYSIKVPAIALSSTALLFLLKNYFNRQRPSPPLVEAARGLSFPSGHALMSFAFYGLLIYLAYKYVKNPYLKWFLIVFLLGFIHLIGFSRVYLRVHYASDVIAGFALGFIWLFFSIWVLNRLEKYSRRRLAGAVDNAPGPPLG